MINCGDMEDLQNSFRSEGVDTDFETIHSRVREIESCVSGESVPVGTLIFTSEIEL